MAVHAPLHWAAHLASDPPYSDPKASLVVTADPKVYLSRSSPLCLNILCLGPALPWLGFSSLADVSAISFETGMRRT